MNPRVRALVVALILAALCASFLGSAWMITELLSSLCELFCG